MPEVSVCLDSSAVVVLLIQERGWQAIEAIITRADRAALPSPGLAEVIYVNRKRGNTATGPEIAAALTGMGVHFDAATPDDLIDAADLIEMSTKNPGPPHPRTRAAATLSLADATILAIAQRLGVQVVTRDHYWNDLYQQRLISAEVVTF